MDLLPTYRKLKSNGAIVELITNGLLIDSIESALEIAESFSRVSVSFDSIVPEEHEVCRGKGTYAKVIAAMKYLQTSCYVELNITGGLILLKQELSGRQRVFCISIMHYLG